MVISVSVTPRWGSDAVWSHFNAARSGLKPPSLHPVAGPALMSATLMVGVLAAGVSSLSSEQAAVAAMVAVTAARAATSRMVNRAGSPMRVLHGHRGCRLACRDRLEEKPRRGEEQTRRR